MAKREKLYTVLLLLVSSLVALALAESALRVVYPKSDIFPAEPAKDPILGHKILPYQTGHDANGFRNDSAKGRFPIACIGDSFIYGNGVPRRKAIPQQLGRLLGTPVYNMGMGGYGPPQYYRLIEDAKKIGAKRIVIGFYLGNDITDTFTLCSRNDYWAPLLKACDADGPTVFEPCPVPCEVRDPSYREPDLPTAQLKQEGSLPWRIHSFLRLNSVLYALSYESVLKPAFQALVERKRHLLPGNFSADSLGIIFTPSVNLTATDLRHEHIQCGLKIVFRIIGLMAEEYKNRDEFLFLLIPTRESVYYQYLKRAQAALPPEFECQVHYERIIARRIAEELAKHGFRCLDPLPKMERAALEGKLLYPRSRDNHPNGDGYSLIAEEVYEALKAASPQQK